MQNILRTFEVGSPPRRCRSSTLLHLGHLGLCMLSWRKEDVIGKEVSWPCPFRSAERPAAMSSLTLMALFLLDRGEPMVGLCWIPATRYTSHPYNMRRPLRNWVAIARQRVSHSARLCIPLIFDRKDPK